MFGERCFLDRLASGMAALRLTMAPERRTQNRPIKLLFCISATRSIRFFRIIPRNRGIYSRPAGYGRRRVFSCGSIDVIENRLL